ncbi:hypothetical protein MRX96_033079 [Rhipicephalus microplus]
MRQPPPSAAIPIRSPEKSGSSQAFVTESPQLRFALSPSATPSPSWQFRGRLKCYHNKRRLPSRKGGTIFEEFTETDQGLVVECARSQNEMAESGQYSGFSTFDEKTNLDILDKD